MEFHRMSRPEQKAVPQTRTIIVRVVLSAVIGLIVLVAGLLRMKDMGAVTLVGLMMPLVGVFLLVVAVLAVRGLPAARKLDASDAIAPGRIVGKWTQTDSDDDKTCYVAYEYGEAEEAFQRVSWKHYRRVEIGEQVDVRYLPEDPSLSRLEGKWYR